MFTLLRLLFLPARVGVGSARLGVKSGYHVGRVFGYRRLLVFAAGVGVGLLVAPVTGQEARAKLHELRTSGRRATEGDLAQRVRHELSHSPRTWHLPQPEVEVVGSTAVLRGSVPHELGRTDLERTAAAVAGIVEVDNHIAVISATGTNGTR